MGLLASYEPPPFKVDAATRDVPFLLTADHAGRLIPARLNQLGLAEPELSRHIAWDIGIAGVTAQLAAGLGAAAIYQIYSRLVVDCNRRPDVASAFPMVSEATVIPGNAALSDADKAVRTEEIFTPYHQEIRRMIAAYERTKPVYVAMHSFTPVYLGVARLMEVAVLYNRNPRLSKILADLLRAEPGLVVAENEPYRVSDETDYGVPVHAEANGLDYVEIEIRQDLIADAAGQARWAGLLTRLLPVALEKLQVMAA
jgi:predicted N-formylglutamate amidohydrolase